MRFSGFSIGHKLPFGAYGRAYFSAYNPRHIDYTTLIRGGSQEEISDPSAFVILFVGFFAVICVAAILSAH